MKLTFGLILTALLMSPSLWAKRDEAIPLNGAAPAVSHRVAWAALNDLCVERAKNGKKCSAKTLRALSQAKSKGEPFVEVSMNSGRDCVDSVTWDCIEWWDAGGGSGHSQEKAPRPLRKAELPEKLGVGDL